MRQTIKDLSLPVGDTQRDFRLHKLDAFSGVRVLKMLSASKADTIQSLLFALSDADLKSLMQTCLSHAEILLPAGGIPVFRDGCWGLPELEFETMTCFRLTQEVWPGRCRIFFQKAAGLPEPPAGLSSGRSAEYRRAGFPSGGRRSLAAA